MIPDYFVKWGNNIFRTLASANKEASKSVLYIFENELEYEIVYSIRHRAIICISGRCDSARADWEPLDCAELFYEESLGQRLAEGERVISVPGWGLNKVTVCVSYDEVIIANHTDLNNHVKQYLQFICGLDGEEMGAEGNNIETNSDVLCFVACIVNHELNRQLAPNMISLRNFLLANNIADIIYY